ncbi:MAG: outer membrane protein assembly factor BamD [Myxococcota bacterium]|nr:outer membrane protein assembly factor BamD [Myxococcota bacterium]
MGALCSAMKGCAAFLAALLALLLTSCASDVPSFEDVAPADELYAEGQEILEGTNILWLYRFVNYTSAIETFQAIIDNYPYSEDAVKAELQIADAYFADERWDEALTYYRDFGDLHPQHERVPYTILRSAQCHYEQIGSVSRDQTSAQEAVHFLEILLRSYPYASETAEGERMLQELRTKLAKNVMMTGDFYLGRGEFQAAAERYRNVLNVHPGLGLDAEALFKLGVCYENLKREDEALRLFHVLMENFRDTRHAQAARAHVAASN